MNTSVAASDALENGPDLFRMVRAYGRAAGTRGLHLPPETEPAVAASLLLQAWAVSVTRVAIASLVGARRMPDVTLSNTIVTFDGQGRPAGASLLAPRFVAVAGDEAATADPWAEIVPDEKALFSWARARLFHDHLGVLVDAVHDRFPVGRRLLWGNVAAATAGRFAALSAEPDPVLGRFDPDHLMRDARRLLDEPGSPTQGLAELFAVAHGGGVLPGGQVRLPSTRLFVRRQTCCLRYRLPDAPPTCLSCRLMPESERRLRITDRLATPVG